MIRVKSVTLRGFRGYPRIENFDLGGGKSLLVFGRNAHGKSSITDAFEFLRSGDGTLDRLGQRRGPTTSGRQPLRNAASAELVSSVAINFHARGKDFQVAREVSDLNPKVPPELRPFVDAAVVPFIIRGPELRDFILQTPQRRYEELARYLNASRLIELQRDIRSLQARLGQDERQDFILRRKQDAQLKLETGGKVASWDNPKVATWLTGLLNAEGLPDVAHPQADDPAMSELRLREANERSTTALTEVRSILAEVADVGSGGRAAILSWKDELELAKQSVAEAARNVADAPLDELIATLQTYLDDPANAPDVCPVCQTPYATSPLGSRDGVRNRIKDVRSRLKTYTDAQEARRRAEASLNDRIENWRTRLSAATAACGMPAERFEALSAAVLESVADETQAAGVLSEASTIDAEIYAATQSKERGLPGRFGALLARVNAVLSTGERVGEIDRRVRVRKRYLETIGKARRVIDGRVHGFFRSTVAAIAQRTIEFYSIVQRHATVLVSVNVRMVNEDNENNRGIELLVDVATEKEQKPVAYLSDSQQNTLALGLRLAIVRHFNVDLPFVVLDDVVTSFDAEMRVTTAEALIDLLEGMQMVILTHDDLFWRHIRDYTSPKESNWKYRRIVKYDGKLGPDFSDVRDDVELIRQRIKNGEHSPGIVRGFWDRWLRETGPQLGARPIMPKSEDPFNYAANDLFTSIVSVMDRYGLRERKQKDENLRRAIAAIEKNTLPNKGVHENDPIDGMVSSGDMLAMLDHYEDFQKLIACGCGRGPRFRFDGKDVRCAYCSAELVIPNPASGEQRPTSG